VSSLGQIAEIEAEVVYYRDRLALLRARLYRQGVATSPRLEELQRRLDSAERRLRSARATAPPWPPGARDGAD
jgi:predicted  nucleic acid-binding Zn-ribbon protein